MIRSNYNIAFNFRVDHTDLNIPLTAEVELHASNTYYVIKNFKTVPGQQRSVLPDLSIKKVKGRWVHCDSEKDTNLSIEVGKAIDAYESEHPNGK